MAARKSTTVTPVLPALTPEQIAAIAAIFAVPAAEPEAAPAAKAGVKASTRKAAPVKDGDDLPATLRQKRTLADYRLDVATDKARTKAQKDKLAAATKAYEAALNAYLLAVGVTGPANLSKSDAFTMIAELKSDRS